MFDITISFDDIHISSIGQEDIVNLQRWLNMQQLLDYEASSKPMNLKELQERFLESYMSESEFFLKIMKEGEIVGIIKGRIEFKNPNEVLIWCFILDKNHRGKGLGTKILGEILTFFRLELGVLSFSTSIIEGNSQVVGFWKKNKFNLLRISKGFFNFEDKSLDMLILKRND